MTRVNPPQLGPPSGFSHGVLAPPGGRMLFVAGQTAADPCRGIEDPSFRAQFDRALEKVLAVVTEAGGTLHHVVSMRVFVTDLDAYLSSREAINAVWQRHMAGHYPAMALVEVSRLVDLGATVEIEAIAVIP